MVQIKEWRKKMKHRGISLNSRKIKAEEWFKAKWKAYQIPTFEDRYNEQLGYYIPDVINKTFKYVIEIDEAYHNTIIQSKKDKKKDDFYTKMSYIVIRVKEYNEEDFIKCVNIVTKLIEEYKNKYPNVRIPEHNTASVSLGEKRRQQRS